MKRIIKISFALFLFTIFCYSTFGQTDICLYDLTEKVIDDDVGLLSYTYEFEVLNSANTLDGRSHTGNGSIENFDLSMDNAVIGNT